MTDQSLEVGIVGAGAIAYGAAALLENNGHRARLWSPSGQRTQALAANAVLQAQGALKGNFHPTVATSAQAVVEGADAILIALPANGHKTVMDAIAPYISAGQTVLISSHASFGALYLARLLAARDLSIPIVAWGTTVTSGRQLSPTEVAVSTIRQKIDIATVPTVHSSEGLAICQTLFGDRFVEREGLLAIALSNLNPQNHMGIALCNLTRMERGEQWSQGQNVTPAVGRLLEALDTERLAIAEALGLSVRTIFEHFHLSFHVPLGSVADMNQAMHEQGRGGSGPSTVESRYVLEDVPFGLVVTARLGQLAGCPALLHEAGIRIFSALYGRDFTAENDLLNALGIEQMTLAQLSQLSRSGYT
ncbi:MAG: NAD/NADP octopine/nopaline dehydrogenase family protein [Candidatus Competibacteraceae bacterium]|nr:NAD/NADP octopine/nopaline dehydrogenase family protein [Candidatus Competibacteraceae bacterium]MCB1811573.1 NAD/NADP octopine/nopaline dehydrogenase family protein [Candidatus Competibacteraceae bacterium]